MTAGTDDFNKYSVKAAGNVALGQTGTYNLLDTTAWTGHAIAIQFLADSTFTTLTEDEGAGGDLTAGPTQFYTGQVIFGDFTAITLATGAARLYLGSPSIV